MIDIAKIVRSLPSSPSAALVGFCDNIREVLNNEPLDEMDFVKIKTFILKFNVKYQIVSIRGQRNEEGDFSYVGYLLEQLDKYKDIEERKRIESDIDALVVEFGDSSAENSFGFARLNSDEKRKIHENISRIRLAIDLSDLPDRKKNALYERLNELSAEVDALGTKTDRFFAFMGDAAFVLGDMAKQAKPMLDEVKDMIKTIGRARSRQEGVSLPPGDTPLSLPAPNNIDDSEDN